MINVLVAYATKHHSTAEIAELIGNTLRPYYELNISVQSVEAIRSIIPYDVIILGSAVYIGTWRPEAVEFLREHSGELANRPVWLFSSGPTGEGSPEELLDGWRYPEALKPVVEEINPRDTAVFHGKLEPSELSFIEKEAIKMVETPTGDYRDWTMIRSWANAIARELMSEVLRA